MAGMNPNLGALGNIPQQQEGMQQASADFMMNLQQLMDIVGPTNVEEAINEMVGSDSKVRQIQGLMLLKEFKEAVAGGGF
jgi:hypothetical protein